MALILYLFLSLFFSGGVLSIFFILENGVRGAFDCNIMRRILLATTVYSFWNIYAGSNVLVKN